MTTRTHGILTENVFERGGEVFLPKRPGKHDGILSALSFVSRGTLPETRFRSLRSALEVVGAWNGAARLLVGAPSPEQDGVRVRSGSRLKTAVKLAQRGWEECVHITARGVRLLTDLDVSQADAEEIDGVLRTYRYSALVIGSNAPVLRAFLAEGWSVDSDWSRESDDLGAFYSDTARIASSRGWATIRVFGHFDDAEASADVIATSSLVQSFAKSSRP